MVNTDFSYSNNSINTSNPKRLNFIKVKFFIIGICFLGIIDTLILLYNYFYTEGQCLILPLGLNTVLGSDCGTVTNSSYGFILGFPISLWGLIAYIIMATMTFISLGNKFFFSLTLLISSFGAVASYVLIWVQYSLIGAWCPLCVASAVFMNLIFLASIYIFFYRPSTFPTLSEFIIADLIMLSITLSILLTFKIYEDIFSGIPINTSNTTHMDSIDNKNHLDNIAAELTTKSFPAALIDKNVINLREIDYKLAAHFTTSQFNKLQNRDEFTSVLYSLRRRALYVLALEKHATQQQIDPTKLVINFTGENLTWGNFINILFAYKEVNSLLEISNKDSIPNEFNITSPAWYNNFITNVNNAIDIQENIPHPRSIIKSKN